MPRHHNTDSPTVKHINAKRKAITPRRLKERAAAGEDVSEQRALVRLGKQNTRILTGVEDLSEWDDEELAKGQKKDKNGRFQGKAPLVVPKAVHNELVRRTIAKAEETIRAALEDAWETVLEVMRGEYTEDKEDPKAKDRLKAAEMVINRIMGKEAIRVEVSASKSKFEEAFHAMIVPDEDTEVIDAESWEAEDD